MTVRKYWLNITDNFDVASKRCIKVFRSVLVRVYSQSLVAEPSLSLLKIDYSAQVIHLSVQIFDLSTQQSESSYNRSYQYHTDNSQDDCYISSNHFLFTHV